MSTFSFAHLLGRRVRADDEHEDDEKSRKAKSRRAQDDEDKEDNEEAQDDEDRKDAEEDEEGKKAHVRKADEDTDDDDDKSAASDAKKGQRAERNRCAKIFGSKYASARPDMAAYFAFSTRLSADEAINALKALGEGQPTPTRATLDSRMRAQQQVRVGLDANQPANGSTGALVNQMTNLYNSAKGIK